MPSPSSEADRAFRAAHDAMLAYWPVPPEDVWLDTPTGKTHLLAAGPRDAPAVFMVPGIATPGVMWCEQVGALVDAHRVYTVDLPGNAGFSEPVTQPRGFDAFARWWVEVLDALGLATADYVGMSYGGCVGAHLALSAPDRLRRLALVAPAATLVSLAGAFMIRTLPQVVWPSRAAFAKLMRWMAVPPVEGRERYETLVEGCIDLFYTGRKRDGLKMLPTVRVLRDEELRRFRSPTLVVIGAEEKIYDASAALARAEALIPGVTTVTIPDASHDLMFTQPARVGEALRAFLSDAPGARVPHETSS
jgi:pimeloyl-ACP methyl ester carboxylesterase